MLLAIDIGNTAIALGVFQGEKLIARRRPAREIRFLVPELNTGRPMHYRLIALGADGSSFIAAKDVMIIPNPHGGSTKTPDGGVRCLKE